MPNTAEYKEYLFVELPAYAKNPWVINNGTEHVGVNWYDETRSFGDEGLTWSEGMKLPMDTSWQIIGKGDAIDWEGIVEMDDPHPFYKNYADSFGMMTTALDSGISLLASLKMEPQTTLVLKKN